MADPSLTDRIWQRIGDFINRNSISPEEHARAMVENPEYAQAAADWEAFAGPVRAAAEAPAAPEPQLPIANILSGVQTAAGATPARPASVAPGTMRVQFQDAGGRLYDVDAPEGTPIDQIAKIASEQAGRELKPIAKPSMGAYALDKAKQGLATIPAMAADMPRTLNPAGAPGRAMWDLIGQYLRQQFGIDLSAQGTQKKAENLLGVEHLPAPSTMQKYLVGKPAEFAGAGLVPGAGLVATAKRPVLAAATELASAYGGGVGAQVGEDVGESLGRAVGGEEGAHKGKTVGTLAGGAGGGGVTAMNAPRLVDAGARGVAKMLPKVAPESAEMAATMESLFTRHFREALLSDPRFKANIEQTLKTRDAINDWLETGKIPEYGPPTVAPGTPNFEPNLSMATGTRSVQFLQQLAETESASAAARGVESRQKVEAALSAYRDGHFPQGERSLQDLSGQELAELERRVVEEQTRVELDMERLKAKVRTGKFGPEEGRELEELKKQQMKNAQALTDARYLEVYKLADQFGFMGGGDQVAAYISRYLRDPNRVAQQAPGFMGDLMGAVKAGAAQTKREMLQREFPDMLPAGITSFVAENGGLRRDVVGGDGLVDITYTPGWAMTGKGGFFLKSNGANAKTPDAMRELAVEAGYLPQNATIDDLYRAIEEEVAAGGPQTFRTADYDQAAQAMATRKARLEEEMGGGSGVGFTPEAQYPLGFGALHSILKRIREEQRYYGGKQTDEARRAMGPLRDLEKITLDEINKAGPEVGVRLGDADTFFRQTVAEPFYRGVAARTFSDRGQIENVADRLLRRGEEGAQNFKQVFGEGERANELLWNGVLEALSKQVGEKEMTSARARAFYEDHRKFLDQFPVIRNRLFAIDQVAGQLEERAAQVNEMRRATQRDLMATLTNSNDPEATLLRALGNEQAMGKVAIWAKKSPELGQAIARTYVDAMEKMKDPAGFLAANEKALAPIFDALGPRQWENVKTLTMGRTIEGRGAAEPIHKPEVVEDPLRVLTGTGTSGIFSRIRGAVYRQISPEYVLVDVGGKYFFRVHQERARELVNQALYDPALAENILALEKELQLPKPDAEKIKGLMREMKGHYATHGLRVALGTFGTSIEDPAEEAARTKGEKALQRYWRQ